MSEFKEEFEPLFDYSRVQPVSFTAFDDYDSTPPVRSKRRHLSDKVEEVKKDGKEIVHVLDNEDTEEWDWLPPPPKVSCDTNAIEEDETIKELRLNKQQLELFTQSAKDVLRSVEETAKRDYEANANANANATSDLEPTKNQSDPSCERPKVVISIQDKKGLKQFRVYKDEKFEKLFKMFADKNKHDMETLTFCFDGDKISPMATPDDLEMEDDDIVEVHIK
ncbi:uncharacterized protein LOC124912133 isoform X2 [Impatiens glandulifera]|uniref:uncharacterized protein LOC124912133 isoform X2 n=1 Tax=Impatiens glandulifera TaxID=253017 RepID=UPI001FB16762|nr:uncharacterized protein LOC124912133 isoform X2 [Impatiens glandulifera]